MRLLRHKSMATTLCALVAMAPISMVSALATPAAAQSAERSAASNGGASAERQAPQNAMLVADQMDVQGRNLLIARGNVEVFFDGQRLRAKSVTYDRQEDVLRIEGPIVLDDGASVVILAGSAELDSQFRNGLILGARMVLDQRVQLAANQISRVEGRYSQLYKVAATSCRVCETGRPPLWQIRAQRTTHDTVEKQLYFDNAQLRVLDVPIFWLPRLRLPDPTLTRATGFLIPSLRQNSQLGVGLRMPYFIRMGDHRDLTLTPYLSPNTTTLELRYRQAFHSGTISFEGAISEDSLVANSRGYLFGEGQFDLANDLKLDLSIEAVTDNAYLLDYDFSQKDRLSSELAVTRVKRDEYLRAALITYQSLREAEDNSLVPTILAQGEYERRLFPKSIGGELRLSAGFGSLYRYSNLDVAGRDVTRADVSANWLRGWTHHSGLQAEFSAGFAADGFSVSQDSSAQSEAGVFTPSAQMILRYPMQMVSAAGTQHILEPMAMIGWVGGQDADVPNEESTRSEFDEGNLLSLSRFAEGDRRERRVQGALGLKWTRYGAKGSWSSLTLGQIYREAGNGDFSPTSGLSGAVSDVLVAGQYQTAGNLRLSARALFDAGLEANKVEARADWSDADSGLAASYVWLGEDPDEDRSETISEWVLDGHYRVAQNWIASAGWRYDVAGQDLAEANFGVNYRNECVDVNLSLSRRFTSSTIVEPSTSIDFTVSLLGFSTGSATGKTDDSYTRSCR